MSHKIKPFPFDKDLIGISKKTLEIHHGKLYAGYVNKRNEIEEKLAAADKSQANATYSEFGELKRQETFTADAMILHERYFKNLGGPSTSSGQAAVPKGKILEQIKKDFGSHENWEAEFKASGLASRGWVVLAYDFNDSCLRNYSCDVHNAGGIWGSAPLIVLDVYEHAYFIDYGSDRKKYIDDYFKNLNWEEADALFQKLVK